MTFSSFHHDSSQAESWQLAALVEQLRERLGAEPPPSPESLEQLEDVLSRLIMRNQRWRLLQRLERTGGSAEHIDAVREFLSRLDAELLQELPVLLEQLAVRH